MTSGEELHALISIYRRSLQNEHARGSVRLYASVLFMRKHGLTVDEFYEDHWQTLFAIDYPEAFGGS